MRGISRMNSTRTSRKLLIRTLLLVACISALCIISLKIYMGTPHASSLLSRTLTSYLRQPVSVTGVHVSGDSVYLTGVLLGNPPDVSPGNLIEVDSIVITPDWGALLAGRRVLRLIALEGFRLDLLKSRAGVWNFARLQHLFSDKKSAGKELLIKQLVVKAGVIRVNGQGAKGISFNLFNLKTKGSSSAQVKLSFEDDVRNSYTVTGTACSGPSPAFDLILAAPALSLNRLAGLLKLNSEYLPGECNGSLRVTAAMQDGRVRATGRLDFSRLSAPPAGSITVTAAYNIQTDEVILESLTVTAENLMKGRAAGTITRLRSERSFFVAIGIDELNLAALTFLIPEEERRKTAIGGMLRGTGLRISGSGSQGLISVNGLLMLKGGFLERGGQLLFKSLNSTAAISRVPDGFLAKGTLSQDEISGAALLKTLKAPFEIRLSRQLKLLKVEIPSLSANVMGLAVSGRLGYNAAVTDPFNVDLRIPAATFSSQHHLPEKLGLKIASGSGSLALKATGRSPRDFTVAATARIATVRGIRGGTNFGIKSGGVDSRIVRTNGQLDIRGQAGFSGLALDGKQGDVSFVYRIAHGTVFLDNAVFSFDGTSGAIARLKALIPVKESIAETVRYPIILEIAGGELKRGQVDVKGFSGTGHGSYFSGPRGSWLEGTADASLAQMLWQGKTVASPAAHVTFSRTGGRGTISGQLLEGGLTGEILFKPLALREGGEFKLGIRSGQLSNFGAILPRRGAATLADGILDGTVSGDYSGASGLACRFIAVADDIALTGSGGKTLLGGAGINLSGGMSGSRFVVDKALLSAGKEVVLQMKGDVINPLSPQREGNLVFSFPMAPLNSIVDPFVNILPRAIQEATLDGSLAADGRLVLGEGRQLLEGSLLLKDVVVDVPSQKFKTAAINGQIPFSLDLSGNTPVKSQDRSNFTRANYPGFLKLFRAEPDNGPSVTIGSFEFGSLNLGEVLLQISAGNGVTKIDSLRSSLYEGALLGSGFVAVKKRLNYRADLLINGLSLKQFCASMPQIKDYISGRLDGLISLNGEGMTLAGLAGFTDFWVREGSGEKMLVSKDFLQKLSGKKLSGIFFSSDRPYDHAEVVAVLKDGYLTFEKLDIVNTNLFGVRDLSVSIAPEQNRIALDHLFSAIKQAADRGKATTGGSATSAEQEFQWQD